MKIKGFSRRALLKLIPASVLGLAASSGLLASSRAGERDGQAGDATAVTQDMSKPASVMMRIESLNPATPEHLGAHTLQAVPLDERIDLRHQTKMMAPYSFEVAVDERHSTRSDLFLTITIYGEAGHRLQAINIGNGGTAIFKRQGLMFYVSANYS
ncbi:hypothetical protein QFW77_04570 [Luteimonas sp. RD2P54]|uniref:Secreted protein n=1 Tax=Luteimonas endophytica TaxID=3042023 RepID=A0ABT6J7T1_9GAMM|nr:hypothetical protein [Luteimonas endophytica]MDH5822263.1 hypothetical protein [Luteimonas endophytica]